MDKYDEEIERLTESPHLIRDSWLSIDPLFEYAAPYGSGDINPQGSVCGCLTMIRGNSANAWTPELTEAIRADRRIPMTQSDITIAHLPIFAEWQRRIDKELNRS